MSIISIFSIFSISSIPLSPLFLSKSFLCFCQLFSQV